MDNIIELLPQNHFGQVGIDVIQKLVSSESVTITGAPGFGKIFFPQFIKYQIENNFADITVFRVSLNLISSKSVEELNRHIAEQLETTPTKIESNLLEKSKTSKIIVIVEGINDSLEHLVMQYLYGIRNINSSRIAILTIADYTIIRNDYLLQSKAQSLFSNLKVLQPFDLDGVKRIIDTNNRFYNWNTPINLADEIYQLSGGIPAIVKEISTYIHDNFIDNFDSIELSQSPSLHSRVSDIVTIYIQESIELSKRLGIADAKGNLISKLAQSYIQAFSLNNVDYLFSDLSHDEKRLLSILLLNKDRIVSIEKLSQVLNQTSDNYSLWAIYKSVQRLRNKVKGRFEIKSIKGKGYLII